MWFCVLAPSRFQSGGEKSSCSFIYSFKCSLVCQNESEDSMVRSFVGRIGVSLMLRYHKTHQWAKVIRPCSSHRTLLVTSWAASSNLGCHFLSVSSLLMQGRRVVETLSVLKVGFSTLKGLFGNEDGASRCCLITVAAEVFLLSGSVEGALNTLRGSDSWSWLMFI